MARPRKSEHASANAKLIDAFWTCLEDHRLTDITISAITKSAELNRGTFYYHFRDIDDLTARAIEVEFNSQALLPGIFDLIAGAPGSITAIELIQQRMQRLSLLIDRGGLDVLSMQIKRLVRQTWTAILCAEGESLKPETLFVIEYTTSGIIGLIANETMARPRKPRPTRSTASLRATPRFCSSRSATRKASHATSSSKGSTPPAASPTSTRSANPPAGHTQGRG